MIVIIGAGLSGLLIAYRLKQAGIPFKILEARDRIGGRINTIYGTDTAPIEMGATWFMQTHQNLINLLNELGISYFKQSMDSKVFYEASPTSALQLVQIPNQAPSFRISGGSSTLINTLFKALKKTDIVYNQPVKQITIQENSVEVNAKHLFEGHVVVLAIPPKLWATHIAFEPQLPAQLTEVALQTQTWMEDSIKLAITYPQPFWKHEKSSGTLFSNKGPISEFYDQSNQANSKHALCGFINASLKQLTNAERREKVIAQLKSMYGKQAEEFTSYEECVWSKEEHTFVASDTFLSPHQNNGHSIYTTHFFDDKLLISSAEVASQFPGHMEGAVVSAQTIAEKLIKAHQSALQSNLTE